MRFKEKIKCIPLSFGVYIMKSKKGQILYIGKASSLRKRLRSYASSSSLKAGLLLDKVKDIEYIVCGSEEQALILESALIKERKPKYNVELRDDKSYPYVEITQEKFPRVFISRPKNMPALAGRRKQTEGRQRKINSIFFGPYPKAKLLKSSLNLIRRIFPYCSCRVRPKKACLFFHINLCPAPCEGRASYVEYKDNLRNICRILRGERKEILEKLGKKMRKLSKEMKFEEAAKLRDKLLAVQNLYKGRGEEHALLSLKGTLNLPAIPLVIEAIDISSLCGKEACGSVVVFRDGIAAKSDYRRYRIKEVEKIDDYAMIGEVARRRYSRLLKEKGRLPDLIIIDGGEGHIRKVTEELQKLKLKIPAIGIAKRNEEVWFADKKRPLLISRDSVCLHLIQRIRDEAHRFAHAHHALRRKKRILQ